MWVDAKGSNYHLALSKLQSELCCDCKVVNHTEIVFPRKI